MRGCLVAMTTVAVCLVISASAIAKDVPITENGGFESPDVPTGIWNIFYSIPGWTPINNCGIEVRDHVGGSTPYEGNQYVELNSNCKSGITQVYFADSWMSSYSASWQFSPRPGTPAENNKLEVLLDGKVISTMGPSAGGSTTNWQIGKQGLGFGDDRYHSLTFRSAGTNPYGGGMGVWLDDVKIIPHYTSGPPCPRTCP
jgi:hypothetical protein